MNKNISQLSFVQSTASEEDGLYAEIIIPLALPQNYTWHIPAHLRGHVQPGVRAEVELKNKKYSGIIKKISTEKPGAFTPKDILNILDDLPLLYPEQLNFWEWMATYYMCTEGEVMQAALPTNFKLTGESILIWNEEYGYDFTGLNDEEYIVAEALEVKKELRLGEVQQLLDSAHVYPVIKKLIDKKVCYIWEELVQKYKPKTETYIVLHPEYHNEERLADLLNNWAKAPRQLELVLAFLHLLKTEGEVTQKSLLKKASATAAQLKGLTDKNILIAEKRETGRIAALPKNVQIDFTLSDAQQKALDEVEAAFCNKQVCLLHGITASGKTQVYIRLIESYIAQGKQVLYMLPEIALTAQIIRRLQKNFGGHIAVYHSKFNANERAELWNKVKTGEIRVILGARSSLFLPFRELALVIIDEEHDSSYRQHDPAPRYHARDAAIYLASLFNAKVLAGSATPSLETYYNAELGKYALATLSERYAATAMPAIQLIDVKQVAGNYQNKVLLSPQLKEAIEKTLAQKKQVILFQNRRGYSPYMICRICGWIPQCKNCDVTLTFHKGKNKLACHYCGSTYPVIQTCAACGSHQFIQKNFGTEKVEESLAEQLPQASVSRMDYDSIKGKYDHDNLIKLFEQQKIDILVGTQMVVKGLDFEHVNLVGILDADGILSFTDFRVNERAFQLMEQVSGRAGRQNDNGIVLIQVSNTKHPVLHFVQSHNYLQFYSFEKENRKNFFYPPFSRIIRITLKHKESFIAEESANIFAQALRRNFAPYVSGPAQPVVGRIRNQYLYELLLKLPKEAKTIKNCKTQIQQQVIILQTNKRYRSVSVVIDVDPA